MRFTSLAGLALLLAFAACLSAAPMTFSATLTGPAEEPPNASPGIGTAFVTIDPVAHTMVVDNYFSGLQGLTTMAHIHVINGPNDGNLSDTLGPVATTTPTFPNFPLGVTAGTYFRTFNTLDTSTYNNPAWLNGSAARNPALTPIEAAELELLRGITEGRAYFNIHSSVFPGGEIRGFLTPVPEPATLGGVAASLGLLLLVRGRRRAARD
jgi:hypothetical protein